MNEREWFQVVAYIGLVILLTRLLGGFMAKVLSGERSFLMPLLSPVERWIYRLAGCDSKAEMLPSAQVRESASATARAK